MTALAVARRLWLPIALAGALLLAWHFQARAVANAEALRAQAAQFRQAQTDANRLAAEALHHQEAVFTARAQEAQTTHESQLASARAAADRFIAAHRVQQPATAGGATGQPASAAQDRGTALPAGLPADSVVVAADDVQACTAAVTYARDAHDWATNLNSGDKNQ